MSIKKTAKGRLTPEAIREQLALSKIVPDPVTKELETSFMDYAMSVIVARALPDVRDGFKPVHRRVLYAAYGLGMFYDRPYKKSARLVGEVIGKFHPHGDSAAYQTMVRMAQNFSMRYLLIDGHGNFGSVDGDSPAAMRYTEARLSKISGHILRDLDKDTVPWVSNYDATEVEPVVLPASFPNLLANGSNGIAVGMATNIPPHNINEVCDAAIALAHNPDMEVDDLMQYIKGPDFPTAGLIVGDEGIKQYFRTGKGPIYIRSRYHLEELHNGKTAVIITEIPYMVNKSATIQKIVDLIRDQHIDGITDLRDESSRDGMRIVIELRRDIVPDVLMNKLFKTTSLQVNFSVNCLALVDGVPKILNLKEMLEHYLHHQYTVLVNKTNFELNKANKSAHLLRGLIIAVQDIDEVIQIIKRSIDNDAAAQALMARFNLDEIQVKGILDMKLRSLSNLEREKLANELKALEDLIAELNSILASHEKQTSIIVDTLNEIKEKFGDERRTEILYGAKTNIDDEDLIPEEDIVITMSKNGYLKRLAVDAYRSQKRGGVGAQGIKTYEDDEVELLLVAHTHTDLLIFTDVGKVYRLRGHEIPLASKTAKGTPAINLIDIEKGEKILAILPVDSYQNKFLVFSTINGLIKRTPLEEYESIRKNGKIAINLREGDRLFSVIQTDGENEIFMGASNGKVIKFNETNINPVGRKASGVIGMNIDEKDSIVGFGSSRDGKYVLSVGANGLGKLSESELFRLTNRGGKGVTALAITDRTGPLVAIKLVNGDEDLLLLTSTGKVIRTSLKDVAAKGRITQGVILVSLNKDETVASTAIFAPSNDEDEEEISEGANENEKLENDNINDGDQE